MSDFGLPKRVLASLHRDSGRVELLVDNEVLVLDSLPAEKLAWLAKLSAPILVEADVVGVSGQRRVIALGHPQPHPKVAALRAVADQRYGTALESLAVLGTSIERDLELLVARMKANAGLGRMRDAQSDFERVCAHLEARPSLIVEAFRALPATVGDAVASLAATRIASLLAGDASARAREILRSSRIPLGHWPIEVLLRALGELLGEKRLESWDLHEAKSYLDAARAIAPADPRLTGIGTLLDSAASKITAREKKAAAALLASRPNFDDVEALFGVSLPKRLRQAWEAHYAGTTIGFGFFPAHKDKLEKLVELTRKLERSTPAELRRPAAPLPHQFLPFAIGEHDDEYFALDLTRRSSDGDFEVLVVFRGRGEAWVTYPSSTAWIDADGATRYE